MPRTTPARIPSYRLHKPTGLAVVRLDGRDFYLGKYGTPESHGKYERLIAEWLANPQQLPVADQGGTQRQLSVNEIFLAYWGHAESYYRKHGKPTTQLGVVRLVIPSNRRSAT